MRLVAAMIYVSRPPDFRAKARTMRRIRAGCETGVGNPVRPA
jgi:hypothetical protein